MYYCNCVCVVWEFSCAISAPPPTFLLALHIHSNANTVSQLMCFHSVPFYLSFPPTADWWLWSLFFLMHHMHSIHRSLSAWYSFRLIILDQPLCPRVQLLSIEQLLYNLPFTAVLKKWKQKNTQAQLVPNMNLFWSLNSVPYTSTTGFVFTFFSFSVSFDGLAMDFTNQGSLCTKMLKPKCCRNLFHVPWCLRDCSQTLYILDAKDKGRERDTALHQIYHRELKLGGKTSSNFKEKL